MIEKNQIVFIGQGLDENKIEAELNNCLSTEEELASETWLDGYHDNWLVHRLSELN